MAIIMFWLRQAKDSLWNLNHIQPAEMLLLPKTLSKFASLFNSHWNDVISAVAWVSLPLKLTSPSANTAMAMPLWHSEHRVRISHCAQESEQKWTDWKLKGYERILDLWDFTANELYSKARHQTFLAKSISTGKLQKLLQTIPVSWTDTINDKKPFDEEDEWTIIKLDESEVIPVLG